MNNIQINGQRRWGPPENWCGPPPVHGTEVFIKNLPEQVFELELYATFSAAGAVYEVRLPVNWDGLNRGYAFVRFTTVRAADEAIETFDGYEIRRSRKIKVARSVDNTRLFLSAVPVDRNAEDLKRDLSNYVENVKKVYVYPTLENRSLFRGYAFVEFETHRDAAIAKRILTPDVCYGLFERKCVAAWANPLPFLERSLLTSLNVLFMRNIPKDIKSFHLKKAIENLTGGEEVRRVKKMNNFAFLTFKDHKAAERALQQLQSVPFLISDHETQVEWAIPREVVASSFMTVDKGYETSEAFPKGYEASKIGNRGRSVCKEELQFTSRFHDFAPSPRLDARRREFSESPDLVLSTQHDVCRYNATAIESESAVSPRPLCRQPETRNEIGSLHLKTPLSPTSDTKNDIGKTARTSSGSPCPHLSPVNNAFQSASSKRTSFHGFSDTRFGEISCLDYEASTKNVELLNFWHATCGEDCERGSEDKSLNVIHPGPSPYSPLSPSPITPRSAESSISSPFLVDDHGIFSESMIEELFFKKNLRDNSDLKSNYFGMEHPQNEKLHFKTPSICDRRGFEMSTTLPSYTTFHHACIKKGMSQ